MAVGARAGFRARLQRWLHVLMASIRGETCHVLVIIGAGGHGSDVADLARRCGIERIAVRDDAAVALDRLERRGVRLLPAADGLPRAATFTLGIGAPWSRRGAAQRLPQEAAHVALIDPSAVVSSSAEVASGVQVFWLAGVSPLVRLGRHVLVSYGATVGHDTVVGEYSSILPGARVSGGVAIGKAVLIGSGAVVLQGLTIGDEAVVGAGAVVTRDVSPGAQVTGVPAR